MFSRKEDKSYTSPTTGSHPIQSVRLCALGPGATRTWYTCQRLLKQYVQNGSRSMMLLNWISITLFGALGLANFSFIVVFCFVLHGFDCSVYSSGYMVYHGALHHGFNIYTTGYTCTQGYGVIDGYDIAGCRYGDKDWYLWCYLCRTLLRAKDRKKLLGLFQVRIRSNRG